MRPSRPLEKLGPGALRRTVTPLTVGVVKQRLPVVITTSATSRRRLACAARAPAPLLADTLGLWRIAVIRPSW